MNATKSVYIKFDKINILTSIFKPKINLENNVLNFFDRVKYLGLILNFNLKEDDDILKERNKFYASLIQFYENFTLLILIYSFIYLNFTVFNFMVQDFG